MRARTALGLVVVAVSLLAIACKQPAPASSVTARLDGFEVGPLEITLPAGFEDRYEVEATDADVASLSIDNDKGLSFEVMYSEPTSLAKFKKQLARPTSEVELESADEDADGWVAISKNPPRFGGTVTYNVDVIRTSLKLKCGRDIIRERKQADDIAAICRTLKLAAAPANGAAPTAGAHLRLAAGETLVEVEKPQTNPLSWAVGGQVVSLAIVRVGERALLRAHVGGDKHVDLSKPFEVDPDMTWYLALSKDAASVHFRARELAGRSPGGAVFAFHDLRVTWDAAAGKPIIADRWECDESTIKGETCTGPAWTRDL